MKRADKITLLQRVFEGQTSELKQLRDRQGRLYTLEEKASQREYLTSLFCREATIKDVNRLFGHYDLSNVPGAEAYLLPNGMMIFF